MPPLTLYMAPHSNTSERVLWVLQYKNIPFQQVNVSSLSQAAYARINPYRYIPTLQIGADRLSESVAMVEYLEAAYPEPTLFPGDLLTQARIREVCEYINSTVHPAQNRSMMLRFLPDLDAEALRTRRARWLIESLSTLSQRLWLDSTFAVGNACSMADIFVAVMYQRALHQQVKPEQLPAFAAHFEALMQVPEVQKSSPFSSY